MQEKYQLSRCTYAKEYRLVESRDWARIWRQGKHLPLFTISVWLSSWKYEIVKINTMP